MTPETPDPPPVSPVAPAGSPTTEETSQAHAYLSRLLVHAAPQCEPLPDLLGVCTQIDNLLTCDANHDNQPCSCGLTGTLAALHAARAADALRHQQDEAIWQRRLDDLAAERDAYKWNAGKAMEKENAALQAKLSTAEATIQQQVVELDGWVRIAAQNAQDANDRLAAAEATITSLEADNAELEADVVRLEARLEQAHVEPGEAHE